jgi:hypothetical protein
VNEDWKLNIVMLRALEETKQWEIIEKYFDLLVDVKLIYE